jgi:NAD-dependent deacetylase
MSSPNFAALIEKAASLLQSANYCVALTGAGISTPSGVPDFRTPQTGLWSHQDPMEVASLTAFRQRPDQFYAWLTPLALRINQAQSNPAHLALARLQQAGFIQTVITQNIDQLHQQAGSTDVVEVHGNAAHLFCNRCGRKYAAQQYFQDFSDQAKLPQCAVCHTVLQPEIILYEQMLDETVWQSAV